LVKKKKDNIKEDDAAGGPDLRVWIRNLRKSAGRVPKEADPGFGHTEPGARMGHEHGRGHGQGSAGGHPAQGQRAEVLALEFRQSAGDYRTGRVHAHQGDHLAQLQSLFDSLPPCSRPKKRQLKGGYKSRTKIVNVLFVYNRLFRPSN